MLERRCGNAELAPRLARGHDGHLKVTHVSNHHHASSRETGTVNGGDLREYAFGKVALVAFGPAQLAGGEDHGNRACPASVRRPVIRAEVREVGQGLVPLT
ncbi:MAG: hypothetical protein ACRDRZ_12690 [Pseudonocardiaceae bacterium]